MGVRRARQRVEVGNVAVLVAGDRSLAVADCGSISAVHNRKTIYHLSSIQLASAFT